MSNKPPPQETPFWECYEAHRALLLKNQFRQSAALLECYEQERKRQNIAIQNLEKQMSTLARINETAVTAYDQIVAVLKRSGMDIDTLLRTEKVFGE